MEYRVVTNSERWRVQYRAGRFRTWWYVKRYVPVAYADYYEIEEFATQADACARLAEVKAEHEREARIRNHGWQERACK